MRTPVNLACIYWSNENIEIEDFIEEIQKEAWNEALEAAAENATAYDTVPRAYNGTCVVNKESILKLKI
jgi:hypothetical protein